jgi:hypothetical protein
VAERGGQLSGSVAIWVAKRLSVIVFDCNAASNLPSEVQ